MVLLGHHIRDDGHILWVPDLSVFPLAAQTAGALWAEDRNAMRLFAIV